MFSSSLLYPIQQQQQQQPSRFQQYQQRESQQSGGDWRTESSATENATSCGIGVFLERSPNGLLTIKAINGESPAAVGESERDRE